MPSEVYGLIPSAIIWPNAGCPVIIVPDGTAWVNPKFCIPPIPVVASPSAAVAPSNAAAVEPSNAAPDDNISGKK